MPSARGRGYSGYSRTTACLRGAPGVLCTSPASSQRPGPLVKNPDSLPVTAAQGAGTSGNAWWLVADVRVVDTGCGLRVQVQPVYVDATARTPFVTTAAVATASFGPPYPP